MSRIIPSTPRRLRAGSTAITNLIANDLDGAIGSSLFDAKGLR